MPLEFSLLSLPFLALSAVSILVLGALRGRSRDVLFLLINLVFLAGVALDARGALVAVGFSAIGYAIVRHAERLRARHFVLALGAFVALFVFMRDYDFLHWLLPASLTTSIFAISGLSFLFFKVVHAAVDVRGGVLGPLDPLHFTNYCLNFTTFLMGPIQRYQDFRAQWSGEREALPATLEAHLDAAIRILVGLVKAYVLGSWLAPFTMAAVGRIDEISRTELLLRIYLFYPYLYLNFSGYCDVVIGVGSLMGVRPPENFDKPFLAENVSDFWLRMHRSLTLWLTDYVFNPSYLTALRRPALRAWPLLVMTGALLLTMIVSGLWHGTTLAFLIFGLLHGAYLIVHRLWEAGLRRVVGRRRAREIAAHWVVRATGLVLTVNAVAIAYVFFVFEAREGLRVLKMLLGV